MVFLKKNPKVLAHLQKRDVDSLYQHAKTISDERTGRVGKEKLNIPPERWEAMIEEIRAVQEARERAYEMEHTGVIFEHEGSKGEHIMFLKQFEQLYIKLYPRDGGLETITIPKEQVRELINNLQKWMDE